MKKTFLLLAALTAARLFGTPAEDRLWATRVACELNTATDVSLPDLTWQQGTTPRLSLDQYRQGKSVNADSNVTAIVRFGPSATSTYFVTVTNYATSGNGYLVDMPTVGTNTTGVAAGWWYTAYFETSGRRFWTGNGRVDIVETTSTEDGLNWQTIASGAETDPIASPLITGLYVSNAAVCARVGALELGTNGWNAAAALGATALQPSWAVTGTVSRAQAAAMLETADGDVWVEIGTNGMLYLVQVTNTLSVIVTSTLGEGYNGPAAGTLFSSPDVIDDPGHLWWGQSYPDGYDMSVDGDIRPDYSHLQGFIATKHDPYTQWTCYGTLPGVFVPYVGQGDPVGQFFAAWLFQTNRYQIATAPGTVIMLTEHDEDPEAHPTLPRYSDVSDTVSAATNGLLSKADAAATYMPTASIPGPGCTDLGTATNLVIDGTSVYYTAAPASAYTITVSQPVSSGYTYCLTTYSDSPITLANADLRNDWVLGGTNTLVFYPGTTNRWLVKGSAP